MSSSENAVRPRRTQAERSFHSELSLLQAAAGLIGERGVNAATFESIGARAGFSRGLATQKFGSKQKLVEALVAYLVTRSEQLMEDAAIATLPGLDAVLAYVDTYLHNLARNDEMRAYFILLAGAVADRTAPSSVFAEVHRWAERSIEALVRRGQAEGNIRAGLDANAAALMVGSLLLGLSTQMLIDPAMDLRPIHATSLATLRASFQAS
jgi:AcrR family transcriptional regulator